MAAPKLDDDPCPEQEDRASNYVWQYLSVSNSSNVKEGGVKFASFVIEPSVDAALQK